MNEVRITSSVASRGATGAASSAGSEGKPTEVAADGKSLPPGTQAGAAASVSGATSAADPVSQAVAELNSYVQNEQRDLLFSVDDGSGDMVVRVVDRDSGELIRQIPNEVVLHLAEKARLNEPLQLIDMHG